MGAAFFMRARQAYHSRFTSNLIKQRFVIWNDDLYALIVNEFVLLLTSAKSAVQLHMQFTFIRYRSILIEQTVFR